jgi:hypothetical protein
VIETLCFLLTKETLLQHCYLYDVSLINADKQRYMLIKYQIYLDGVWNLKPPTGLI